MDRIIELAGGSVRGYDHAHSGKNNQDSYCWLTHSGVTVAVVTDGCGSSKSRASEAGAIIGARIIAARLLEQAVRYPHGDISDPYFWERNRQDVLAILRTLALAMGGSYTETVKDHFLFSVIGTLITPLYAVFFSIGDGVIVINDETLLIGPFPDNQPPYLGYDLLDPSQVPEQDFRFQLQRVMPAESLRSFLIGVDGAATLITAEGKMMPGQSQVVGSISQFWLEDRVFTNPTFISRRLAQINRSVRLIDWQQQKLRDEVGLLPDDTTVIVGRVKEEGTHA